LARVCPSFIFIFIFLGGLVSSANSIYIQVS
jgi:hypothetical protein